MKFILFLFILPILFCSACVSNKKELSVINRAETLLMTNPDSAYCLLNSITFPSQLDDKLFAHWCMLSGKVADRLHKEMPYDSYLLKALNWYELHGTTEEQAQIGLYVGRAFVEDGKKDEAMVYYLNALTVALKGKNYNVAGYICSYIGDLYKDKDLPDESRNKYKAASEYFLKAYNMRSYVLALRDVSFTLCMQDSLDSALDLLKHAESKIAELNDSTVSSSIMNAIGNIYFIMDSLDGAEKYLLKSLDIDKDETAPTYLALSKMYMSTGNLDKAQYYLDKSKINATNDYTLAGIMHQNYLLEKRLNNPIEALSYLESYCHISDSITMTQNKARVVEIEKKYDHVKMLNEHNQLRIEHLWSIILLIIAIVACLLLAFLYQIKSKRDNRIFFEQQRLLDNKEKKLLQLLVDLDLKEKELAKLNSLPVQDHKQTDVLKSYKEKELIYKTQKDETSRMRKEIVSLKNKMLLSAPIAKKFIKLSQMVVPGATKSPVTLKDWQTLMNKVDDVYSMFKDNLLNRGFKEDSVEIQYCYLSLLVLDKYQESVILHINPSSVSKLRFRVRQKLQISADQVSIYEYLVML